MATFKPEQRTNTKTVRHINYTCGPKRYAELEMIAQKAGVSLKELLRQMVDFSLSNMEHKLMEKMLFVNALALNVANASDDDLQAAWHSYAGQISYHHADDSGKEWGSAAALMPRAREIESEIRRRGLERPTGQYLMSASDRIDWLTGGWEPGWAFKKVATSTPDALEAKGGER